MGKFIVIPGPGGLISNAGQIMAQPFPANAVVVDHDAETLTLAPQTAAIVKNGKIEFAPNWIGSGPWFDQNAATADRLQPIEITDLGIEPKDTWAMTPRDETSAEKKAREKAEADTKAAAEAASRASATVTMAQFRKALLNLDMLDQVEVIMADASTPKAIRIDWEFATVVHRDWPSWAGFLTATGKTGADLDAVFALAATL